MDRSTIRVNGNTFGYAYLVLATGIQPTIPRGIMKSPQDKQNPLWIDSNLPYYPAHGMTMEIHLPELSPDWSIIGSISIVPLPEKTDSPDSQGMFRIGSTYRHDDIHACPQEQEIRDQVEEMCNRASRIITGIGSHELLTRVRSVRTGSRPTSRDRKPYIGPLVPDQFPGSNILTCNGLGTRGFLSAPSYSSVLISWITKKIPIDPAYLPSRVYP